MFHCKCNTLNHKIKNNTDNIYHHNDNNKSNDNISKQRKRNSNLPPSVGETVLELERNT